MLYAGTMKCPSKQVVDQLNVMQRGVIWNNKKPKIKQSTLVADYSEGGYKDIDIKTKISAFKVQMKCFSLLLNLKEQQKSGRSLFTIS